MSPVDRIIKLFYSLRIFFEGAVMPPG
uniref:Uncharacterized protein n=1 Tax=Anguilla anguilla TaxID=7936 RepID=A0A0E9QKY8_ANGAN